MPQTSWSSRYSAVVARITAALALPAALASGCARDAAGPSPASEQPAFAAGGGATSSFTLVPENSNQVIGPIALDSFPSPTLIHATVAGSETEYWTAASNPSYAGQVAGTYGWGGHFWGGACVANIELSYGFTSIGYCSYGGQPVAGDTWRVVEGQGTLSWNRRAYEVGAGADQICGRLTTPCYTETGSFTVTIERPAAQLVLALDRSVVPKGQSVGFRARRTPATAGGQAIPFIVQNWSWQPVTGAARTVGCDTVCAFSPDTSGTMTVTAVVNGVAQNQSRYVLVTNCPPVSDSVLDDADVRRRLNDEWQKSDQSQKERGGWILEDPVSGRDTMWIDTDAGLRADRCNIPISPIPPAIPGYDPIGTWHTHIIPEGKPYGAPCGRADPSKPAGNGPSSTQDVPLIKHSNRDGFVIDDNELWKVSKNSLVPGGEPFVNPPVGWTGACRAAS